MALRLENWALPAAIAVWTLSAAANAATPQTQRNEATLVATPHDVSVGKLVQSPGGEIIGTVSDLVPNASTGEPEYVLIVTSSGTAALPFWAVSHLLRDAHFVLSPAELASAPRVGAGRDRSDAGWKREADRYWQAYR